MFDVDIKKEGKHKTQFIEISRVVFCHITQVEKKLIIFGCTNKKQQP